MFGHRCDGKKVKIDNIIDKAGPFFMPMRIDAVNYVTVKVPCSGLDEFIVKERRAGNQFTYMHVVMAAIVRVLYIRKYLNRFIMQGVPYQRNGIYLSMDVKKDLRTDTGEAMTLKFLFTGRENIYDVKNIVDGDIEKNMKSAANTSDTSKAIKGLTKFPAWIFRFAMACVRFMDRHGMLTKGLVKASPFHTSCFITNLKSIKLGAIYHHLYNFGTTSVFISIGKEKLEPVVNLEKEVVVQKTLTMGFSLDERIADGLYMSKSLKLFEEYLKNPELLKESMPDDGSIPKKLTKAKKVKKTKAKKAKKTKTTKPKKEKKPKKIKPLKNKEKAMKRLAKKQEKAEKIAKTEE